MATERGSLPSLCRSLTDGPAQQSSSFPGVPTEHQDCPAIIPAPFEASRGGRRKSCRCPKAHKEPRTLCMTPDSAHEPIGGCYGPVRHRWLCKDAGGAHPVTRGPLRELRHRRGAAGEGVPSAEGLGHHVGAEAEGAGGHHIVRVGPGGHRGPHVPACDPVGSGVGEVLVRRSCW